MDYQEFSAKTLEDAITEACSSLSVTSAQLEYEVVNEGTSGFLGMGAKPATIKARIKQHSARDVTERFLSEVFSSVE